MEDFNKIYYQVIKKTFEGKDYLYRQILEYSKIKSFDLNTRILEIDCQKEFVKKLIKSDSYNIKTYFEYKSEKTVDKLSINGEVVLTDMKDLSNIKKKIDNIENPEIRRVVETIEKSFETDVFVEQKHKKNPSNNLELNFWNEQLGLGKKILYIKGDFKWQDDIKIGSLFFIFLIGIPFLIRGINKRRRLMKVIKQIETLQFIKYRPATKRTKRIVDELLKAKNI